MKSLSILFALILSTNLSSQSFTDAEKLQGYKVEEDMTTFIFDPAIYDRFPGKVVVTGAFRNWDTNMDDSNWILSQNGALWTLTFVNPDKDLVMPQTPFKFRLDDGEWVDPPTEAPNQLGGNLIFLPSEKPLTLKAELLDSSTIWAWVSPERPLSKDAYRLTDANGAAIPIAAVLPNMAEKTLIKTAVPLDKKRVYFLEIPDLGLKAFCSFDGWFRTCYSSKPLGANVQNLKTSIRLFAPRAIMVKVYLYKHAKDTLPYRTENLREDENGVWEIIFDENLAGVYYDFTVHGHPEPGNFFYETNPVHITDPYARVSDNTWGKARIWEQTSPADPLPNGIPSMEDVIAYEVHVQDFTEKLPVPAHLKGTFKAMITPGLKNQRGEKIGFDYLVDLGINTVHLMPVQEYLHFPDDDWKASFKDDPYMIEQGVSEENYQWGYRTSHFFAVESKYRTKGSEPGTERNEFRDLVQAFHKKGIAVIIDIVPNHTAENMDGNEFFFNFNAIDKLYYYRTKDFDHIGEYGNEVKTENRPMVQRWLIDQCRHFIEEFGIDGFRIDLAGQIDQQTLKALKQAIGEDKILYGEAWIGSNDPDFEANPDWDWYKEDAPITFFQDDARNAYKGPVFTLQDKYQDRGWPGGKFDERENVMKGLAAKFPTDKTPLSGISYLDIHDNFALADQFATRDFDGRFAVDQDLYKIAVTLLYTTLGPIVTHGGSEIMRSKGMAPLKEVVKTTKAGYKIAMHGKRDTYNHRYANQFLWENVGATPNAKNANDYKNMQAFWRGMNAFRLSNYGWVFRQAEPVPNDYYQFFTPADESLLGYLVDGKVLVLLNPGKSNYTFENIFLPEGSWKLIANNREVNHEKGIKDSKLPELLQGGRQHAIQIGPESLQVWVLEF